MLRVVAPDRILIPPEQYRIIDELTDAVLAVVQPHLDQLGEDLAEEKNINALRGRILERRRTELERAEAALDRVRRAANQWPLAAHEGDLSIAWSEAATAVTALIDNPTVTYAELGFTCPAITGHAVVQPPPAHNDGPTVREAAADDRRWPLQKHGE